jgi:hypothetical protein
MFSNIAAGSFLPSDQTGHWATAYVDTIERPLGAILGNQTWGDAALTLLWGMVGLLVYTLFEHLLRVYQDVSKHGKAHASGAGSSVIGDEYVPREKELLLKLLWRALVLGAAFAALVALRPLLADALRTQRQLVPFALSPSVGGKFVLLVLLWTFVGHIIVVTLRLIAMRTRLFGDEALPQ